MKAKKVFFNGEQFDICDNLQELIQNSLDSRAPNKCIVKRITVGDYFVEIPIIRIPQKHYKVAEGCISLGDAMMLSGTSNKIAETWFSYCSPQCRNLMKYQLPISEIVDGYNMMMKRNNKLLDMEVIAYYDEITFTLIFKK